jgi:hypothetical protein
MAMLGLMPQRDAKATQRMALVIGNSQYEGGEALANPGRDADAVLSHGVRFSKRTRL